MSAIVMRCLALDGEMLEGINRLPGSIIIGPEDETLLASICLKLQESLLGRVFHLNAQYAPAVRGCQ